MATYTATSFASKVVTNAPPGVNAIYATYTAGNQTMSVGDVIFLAKLPPKCKVLEFIEDHTAPSTSLPFDFGLPAADLGSNSAAAASCIATDLTKNTVNRANKVGKFPIQVDVTATDRDYSILQALVTGNTGTVSLIMRATVLIEPNNDQSVG